MIWVVCTTDLYLGKTHAGIIIGYLRKILGYWVKTGGFHFYFYPLYFHEGLLRALDVFLEIASF